MAHVQPSLSLLKKLQFIQKHSKFIQVSPTMTSSSSICISMPRFCDFSIGIEAIEFINIVKHGTDIEIEDEYINYTFKTDIGDKKALVKRKIKLYDLNYKFSMPEIILTIKLKEFKVLTEDNLKIIFRNNELMLKSEGFIKTCFRTKADLVDGVDDFEARVLAKELKVIESMNDERVICFLEDCIVFYNYEDEITTSVIIKVLQ